MRSSELLNIKQEFMKKTANAMDIVNFSITLFMSINKLIRVINWNDWNGVFHFRSLCHKMMPVEWCNLLILKGRHVRYTLLLLFYFLHNWYVKYFKRVALMNQQTNNMRSSCKFTATFFPIYIIWVTKIQKQIWNSKSPITCFVYLNQFHSFTVCLCKPSTKVHPSLSQAHKTSSTTLKIPLRME